MKKIAVFFGLVVLLAACGDAPMQQPEKLIDEAVMAEIIYDLSVMEAMKSRNTTLTNNLTSDYIYKKYKIDSLQFAQNSQYYSADIDKYKKIYEKVAERLELEKKEADSLAKKGGQQVAPPAVPNDDTPRVQ